MALPLKLGMSDSAVQAVRAALKVNGFDPGYTVLDANLYDSWVQLAVANYQKKVGLPVTGVVDARTWTTMTGTSSQPYTAVGAGAAPNTPDTVFPDLTVGLASGKLNTTTPLAPVLPRKPNPGMGKIAMYVALAGAALWYASRRGWLR